MLINVVMNNIIVTLLIFFTLTVHLYRIIMFRELLVYSRKLESSFQVSETFTFNTR
jgi:hypothetical protein